MAKDLIIVEENIGDIKVELYNIAVDREKRKIGETLLGQGGFLQVMASHLKKRPTKHSKLRKNNNDKGALISQYTEHKHTIHCKKHKRRETTEEFADAPPGGEMLDSKKTLNMDLTVTESNPAYMT